MNYTIRKAVPEDLDSIMGVMEAAQKKMSHPEWFCSDEREYMRDHIDSHGFTLVAETKDTKELAGFFLIKHPGPSADNLGRELDYPEELLPYVFHMDMAVVHPDHQGNRLQSRMLHMAEEILSYMWQGPKYLLVTVHPDNLYSLNNMTGNGYEIKKLLPCTEILPDMSWKKY